MERAPNEPCFDQTFRYDNALIKPNSKPIEKLDFKTKYILIDSRDRNYNRYPNSNDYQIMLNEPIKDVVEVELIQAHIPHTSYLINNNNNKIYYYLGTEEKYVYNSGTNVSTAALPNHDNNLASSTLYEATIEPGDWDATNIADRITEAFRVNGHDISVYYHEPTNKFSFVNNDKNILTNTAEDSDLNIYLDFRRTNHITGSNSAIDIVVSTTNYDNYGNLQTSYKNQSMGEILGFGKNYHTTDDNCLATMANPFSIDFFDSNDMPLDPPANNPGVAASFTINLSKKMITDENPNFKFTIGSVIKCYHAAGYVTGIINNYMGVKDLNTDRINCTWLSGLGNDDGGEANNAGIQTGFLNIATSMSDGSALLGGDDYMLLKIPNLERFEGKNTNIERSYAKLHLGTSTRNIWFGRISAFSNLHVCEPTIQKFDRIHLQFTDYYGNPYDFNNAENSLVFAIKYKTVPYKYDF